jgi:hypothetical protein
MPEGITPAKIQNVVKRGFERIQNYRKARAMFLKEYVGQYYRDKQGMSGDEPINLIYQTVKTYVPNMVMQNPITDVSTDHLVYKGYADMLGLAVDKTVTDLKLKETMRAWVVSAIFAFGVMKVSLASSENMIVDGDVNIDPGQVYAEIVDLDDFVFDPTCTDIRKSSFLGSRVRVPRQQLLDDSSYDKELVMKLPTSKFGTDGRASEMTQKSTAVSETYTLQDYVDVVELWIPEANALVTISDPQQIILDGYLRSVDYHGPAEGPYVFLNFSPPVPGNPLPVAPVSLWYDLHMIANRTFKRMMDQADRQKDILAYSPAFADEAQDIIDAEDGDSVAVSDPQAAQVMSFGGANNRNEQMVQQMQMWFNYMAGNPDQMAGNMSKATKGSKETATRTQAMQSNMSVSLDDAQGLVHDAAAEVSKRIAWYLHTDPLIDLPLTKRTTGGEYQQITLTPEQRQGDFLDYTFKIRAKSMVPTDPITRARLMTEFATQVLPNVTNSANIAFQMGVPFNLQRCLTDLAEQMGLTTDVMPWFDDPEFNQRMNLRLQLGPQNQGKDGSGGGQAMQNGGFGGGQVNSPVQQFNQDAQAGANSAQSSMGGG